MLNKDKENLLDILSCLEKIKSFIQPFKTADEFYQMPLNFDATMMNLIVIGEAIARLSKTFLEENHDIEWIKIKGVRNVIAHDYLGIDAEEIWQIIVSDSPILEKKIKTLLLIE